MNALMALAMSSGGLSKQYVDDVFSAYTYSGNGATQTITNGIDLAGKGGLVWTKGRIGASSANSHALVDTARGVTKYLSSDTSNGDTTNQLFTNFGSTGYTLDSGSGFTNAGNGTTYVSWTFRKAPKFFDVVTYTGNGVANRRIAHSLGCEVGMMVVKRLVAPASYWWTYHRSLGLPDQLRLDGSTAKDTNFYMFGTSAFSSTEFGLGTDTAVNENGVAYVAYLFAHDPSADGLIQCGTFVGTSKVTLGWEPQFVLVKKSSFTGNWFIQDTSRGLPASGNSVDLSANLASSEATNGLITIDSTGFTPAMGGDTTIYMAIRRSNKPPTSGTQVYNAITGDLSVGVTNTFPPDMFIYAGRGSADPSGVKWVADRLRGGKTLTIDTAAEATNTVNWDKQNFISEGFAAISNAITFLFKRAVGVFDTVCYTGTGANRSVNHGLGVPPELWIVKSRNGGAWDWVVGSSLTILGATSVLALNGTGAKGIGASAYWNSTLPSGTALTLGTESQVNSNTVNFVAHLFATKAGISKVGSYTGNGTSQNIDCDFAGGARFLLIKRTDAAGDWFVWDTVRGIVAGNDQHLSLNTTAAEVTTDDSIDPLAAGFIVNQVAATNINVNAATYIFLAIA